MRNILDTIFKHFSMKRNTALKLASFVCLLFVLLAPRLSFAAVDAIDEPADLGLEYADETGLTNTDVRTTVASIINVALGLLGMIAVVIFVYAGFLWMTAAGNDEQVTKAKTMMIQSVVGMAIILSAYAIVNFVVVSLLEATN